MDHSVYTMLLIECVLYGINTGKCKVANCDYPPSTKLNNIHVVKGLKRMYLQ